VNLNVHQDGGSPRTGIPKYWGEKLSPLKFQCRAITKKCPETVAVVQVHKMLSDIEILVGCTMAKVDKSSEWTTIVNSAEDNRVNFCKFLDGKQLFSALYGMYMVTLNELKTVLKVNKQAG
jgi:hypothetical protein